MLDIFVLAQFHFQQGKNIDHVTRFPFKQKGSLDYRNPQACVLWMCDLAKKIKQEPDVPPDVAEEGFARCRAHLT